MTTTKGPPGVAEVDQIVKGRRVVAVDAGAAGWVVTVSGDEMSGELSLEGLKRVLHEWGEETCNMTECICYRDGVGDTGAEVWRR